jgi:hypothetical protein
MVRRCVADRWSGSGESVDDHLVGLEVHQPRKKELLAFRGAHNHGRLPLRSGHDLLYIEDSEVSPWRSAEEDTI